MGRTLPPGFRFHPTDIELVLYYLKRKLLGKPLNFKAIADVDLYKYSPWDLPDKSCLRSRDQEWYFFCPRDRKYNCGSRTNRATENGYWKTTGRDRPICNNLQTVGMKKTLVFHLGRAPSGNRTNWVMHEYKLEDKNLSDAGISLDAYVLCKVFEKSGAGPKNGEQYGAPFKEEDWEDDVDENSLVPFLVGHPSPAVVNNKNTGVENRLLDIQDKCGSVLEPPHQGASSNISVDNPPLAEDLDIETLMACFGGSDNLCDCRNASNKDSDPFNSQVNVLGPTRMDGNDIFGGLEDICTRAELQAANTPHPANLCEKFVLDQSLLGHDINYLELNDLDCTLEYPGPDYLELNDLGCSMENPRPAI